MLAIVFSLSGCTLLFPTKAGSSLAHFDAVAPEVGQIAPQFELVDTTGNLVKLAQMVGEQPLVLQLGSYTCPVFRYRRFDMQPLRQKYRGRVKFLVVYTQEAHPVGVASPYSQAEWNPWINRLARVQYGQTRNFAERRERAYFAKDAMGSNAPFLIDDMANAVWQQYGRAPSAAFLLDRKGQVRLRQPWVEPRELAAEIERLLSE